MTNQTSLPPGLEQSLPLQCTPGAGHTVTFGSSPQCRRRGLNSGGDALIWWQFALGGGGGGVRHWNAFIGVP